MLFFINLWFDYPIHRLEFKYISCYSLSGQQYSGDIRIANLNTSHVILYRRIAFFIKFVKIHLNTSHVILYRYV